MEDLQIREILEEKSAILFQEKRDHLREQAREAISKIRAESKQSHNRKLKLPKS